MKNKILSNFKNVWVAGHNGMVGSAIVRNLEENNINVLKVDKNLLDLRDQAKVDKWFAKNKPDLIFLAAAKVGGILANKERPAEFISDNILIQSNIINCSFKYGVNKLVFLGSSCIYPVSENLLKESDLMNGKLEETNIAYAVAKIAGIEMCRSFNNQYNCNYISVLPCNLYGPNDNFSNDDSHVIPALIRKIYEAKKENENECSIWGSGKPLREFLYVDDLATGLIFLADKYDSPEPINIGSGEEYSIKEIALKISDIVGYKGNLAFDENYPDGVMRKILNSEKINKLGWKPESNLDKNLQKTFDWFVNNKNLK
ncbi:MAG: GDP-fucose synthetase [Candidatus Marinimicrobia bacterium]|nr:GDP-fucose synthetase [Candidatus Neomarinimicrobiota bacterium]|tara:strand:+ start:2266 stop:3210 length:945 start_codon:yes stop_codon:yes gene_type:complete